jgi:sodium pump decarboxylase gamma subunit
MTATELLARFGDPQVIQTLSTGEKLTAGLITTVLGMGITFCALIILQFVIGWMDKVLNRTKKEAIPAPASPALEAVQKQPAKASPDDTELIAVITTVIAARLKTTTDRIVIKNIEKFEDRSPAWNRAGIIEQMNSRL